MDDFNLSFFHRKKFRVGEVIFDEGTHGEEAYLLDAGAVDIQKQRPDGWHPIGRIKPGGIFGEMALIDDAPRMARAVAVADSLCVVITRERLKAKLDAADPLLRGLLRIFVQNIRSLAQTP